MTEVVPFRGILYNREKVAGDDVIAPPYDVITPGMREEFYAKSPYNIVKVDAGLKLPGDTDTENKYTRAAAHMEGWLSEGVMVRDPAPAYYVCGIEYTMDGEKKTLFGLFGSVRLVELGKGVYPHEAGMGWRRRSRPPERCPSFRSRFGRLATRVRRPGRPRQPRRGDIRRQTR